MTKVTWVQPHCWAPSLVFSCQEGDTFQWRLMTIVEPIGSLWTFQVGSVSLKFMEAKTLPGTGSQERYWGWGSQPTALISLRKNRIQLEFTYPILSISSLGLFSPYLLLFFFFFPLPVLPRLQVCMYVALNRSEQDCQLGPLLKPFFCSSIFQTQILSYANS